MILNGLPKSTKRNVAPVTSSRLDLPSEVFSLAYLPQVIWTLVCQCVLCLQDIFYEWMTLDTKQTTATQCWYKVLQPIVIMMLITFSFFFPWRCGAQITYFGIWLNISEFGVNIYLTQFIFAAIEFPAKMGAYFFIQRIGRRPGEMGALLLTGVCLLINLFVTEGNLQMWNGAQ